MEWTLVQETDCLSHRWLYGEGTKWCRSFTTRAVSLVINRDDRDCCVKNSVRRMQQSNEVDMQGLQ